MIFRKLFVLTFIVGLWFNCATADAEEGLLERLDQINKIADDFAFSMEITVSKDSGQALTQKLSGYVSVDTAGEVKSLIHFDAPADVRGRKMLIEGSYIWAAFPRTRNLVRLSPLQVLLGDVSYGDILRVIYHQNYLLMNKKEVEQDGVKLYELGLKIKPKKRGSGYHSLKLLVDSDLLIRRVEIFGSSEKLMKTAYFTEPKLVFGKRVNTLIRIESAITKGSVSVLRYIRFEDKKLPARSYNKNALNRLNLSEI